MILVDTALQAREAEGQADPCRHHRRRLHGARPDQSDRQQRAGHAGGGDLQPQARRAPWMPSVTPDSNRSSPTTQKSSTTRSLRGRVVATEDAMLVARSEHVDVLVETTGSVDFGARVLLEAFAHGKDVVLMNAEIDATIGPILQVYAAKHGVVLSACEGDEPGIQINLFRWVKGLGLTPRVIGNIKGLQDPYRTPDTQRGFAEKWGQNPAMVTSFADGSKISFEQAIVANATGFVVRSRGMSRGCEYRGDVMTIGSIYDIDEVRRLGGIVDYVVGTPLTKVYSWRSIRIRSSSTT